MILSTFILEAFVATGEGGLPILALTSSPSWLPPHIAHPTFSYLFLCISAPLHSTLGMSLHYKLAPFKTLSIPLLQEGG